MIFVRDQRRETLIVAMLTGTRVAFILRISLSRPCLETRGFSLCPVSREKYFKSTYFRDKIPKNFNAINVSSICCLSLKSVAPIWRIVFTEYQLIWRDMLQSTFRYLRNYIVAISFIEFLMTSIGYLDDHGASSNRVQFHRATFTPYWSTQRVHPFLRLHIYKHQTAQVPRSAIIMAWNNESEAEQVSSSTMPLLETSVGNWGKHFEFDGEIGVASRNVTKIQKQISCRNNADLDLDSIRRVQ